MSFSLASCLFSIWRSKIIYNSFLHSRPLTSPVSHIDTALDISILLNESLLRYKLLQQNTKKPRTKSNVVTEAVGHAYKKETNHSFYSVSIPHFFLCDTKGNPPVPSLEVVYEAFFVLHTGLAKTLPAIFERRSYDFLQTTVEI